MVATCTPWLPIFSVHNVYLSHKELLEIPRGERIPKCKNVKEVISMKQKWNYQRGGVIKSKEPSMRGYFWINAIVHIQKAHLQVTVDQQRANHTGSEAKLTLVSCSVFFILLIQYRTMFFQTSIKHKY